MTCSAPTVVRIGRPLVTPAALSALVTDGYRPHDLLRRHERGDRGLAAALRAHDEAAILGACARVDDAVSVYRLPSTVIVVVTDRDAARTTIMLADELPA